MQPIIDVQSVTKSFGERVLFENISFTIAKNQKVGLIAKNGTGKSTLLSIITGNEPYDSGNIIFQNDVKIGYLKQKPEFTESCNVLEACIGKHKDLERELKAKSLLTQLYIFNLEQPINQLSGGEQKRVALAKILLDEPNFLILDEPTNHLDLDSVEWLEKLLSKINLTLLIVTHDRYFLDNVCNSIIELDDSTIYTYKGNYQYYLEKRQERIENTEAQIQQARNLYRSELEWIRKMPKARSHKAKYRENAFTDLEKKAQQQIVDRQIKLETQNVYIGSKIFECHNIEKKYENRNIINNFSYIFARFEKLGIIGNNGTGKSTFIKMLVGEIQPDYGNIEIGSTIKFGYYSQQGFQINPNEKVIDVVRNIAEYVELKNGKKFTAAQLLQRFLFSPNEQHNFVYKLSGGELKKLYLCTVLMQNPNFLILDEPTNDLDIQTLQILEDYLINFPGCIIIISHDRYFMDKIVDHILIFEGHGKINKFPGNYSQYREWKNSENKKEEVKKTKDKKEKKENNLQNDKKKKLSYKEKLLFQSIEKEISQIEEEQEKIANLLSSGTLSSEELTKKSKRLHTIQIELDEKLTLWMELGEKQL